MSFIRTIFPKKYHPGMITIVSGLPRSGTSMMMQMITAGGIEPVTDNIRKADEDNPKGYYEFEKVKAIKEDTSWLPGCRGKLVKMVSMLLLDLPPDYYYKIIFMKRRINEILLSQRKMLDRMQHKEKIDDIETTVNYGRHLLKVQDFLKKQKNMEVLYIWYHHVIENAEKQAKRIKNFMGGVLKVNEMVKAVDKELYRNRGYR
ncbi:MAG: sulfotransferase domain-containing protein [Spirochaetales bacterium]|nr:sulfotransferase domain-containing protein [Spirochaetales bacterium]